MPRSTLRDCYRRGNFPRLVACLSYRCCARVTRLLAALFCVASLLSGTTADAQDLRLSFPQQFTLSPKGVNLQTGWFVYDKTDLSVGPLKFVRTRAMGEFIGGFGAVASTGGWSHNYIGAARHDNSTNQPFMHVWTGERKFEFKVSSGPAYTPAEQSTAGATLTRTGNQLSLIDQGGNQYTFSGTDGYNFYLQKVVYANGTSTTITYSGTLPRLIQSNLGFAVVLDYSANKIVAACGFNTAQTYVDTSTTCASNSLVKVTYGYDGASRLTSVTDTKLGVTGYTYATQSWATNLIACVTLVNSSTCALQMTYPGEGYTDAVASQTTAAGNNWQYRYTPPANPADLPQQPCYPYWSSASMWNSAKIDDSMTNARYDRGYLVQLGTSTGTYDYLYANGCATYNGAGFAPVSVEARYPWPTYVRKPDGIREWYQYDTRGNVLTRAVLPKGTPEPYTWSDPNLAACCVPFDPPNLPAGTLFSYASYLTSCTTSRRLCDKPQTVTDPNGNVTTMTYDPAHGGMLTQTSPAVNGITAQTRYAYVQRQAWVKSSGSSYVQTGENVYLLDTKSICKNGNPNSANTGCATAGDEVVTKYDYGPNDGSVGNNLLLKSVIEDYGGLNLRTCYKYDAQGNKVSETKPRGAVSGCP